jgi:stearoyl-CoA desaturase (delta-9 desaturase)
VRDQGGSPQPPGAGLNKVLWQGAFLYHREAKDTDSLNTYGKGTPEDWVERVLYTRFNVLGVVLMLVIDIVLFGLAGAHLGDPDGLDPVLGSGCH